MTTKTNTKQSAAINTLTFDALVEKLGDDALLLQTAKTALLLPMATGQVDATQMARHELAQRGLNEHGTWIGFAAAAKLWEAPTEETRLDIEDDHLVALAQVHLGIETLETRSMDELDFHEVGFHQLKAALRAAFELGRASK
jgi:hypothetical protein